MKTTWKDVFCAVCTDMEKTGEFPKILDYHLAPGSAENVEFDTDDMTIPYAHLDYGCEGIYLCLYVFGQDQKPARIGTFKTLYDGEEDMETMSLLYGRFINALYRWAINTERRN